MRDRLTICLMIINEKKICVLWADADPSTVDSEHDTAMFERE